MRIVTISQRPPRESGKGDQHLLYHRIKALLSDGHEVHSIFFKENTRDYKETVRDIKLLGVVVHEVEFSIALSVVSVFLSIFTKEMPFQCAIFTSRKFQKKLEETVQKYEPALLYISFIRVLFNAKNIKIRKSIDLIDSLSLNYSRREVKLKLFSKKIISLEMNRIIKLEKNIFNFADIASVVSNIDKKWIENGRIKVIPLGVDTDKFRPCLKKFDKFSIIFSGNLSYSPNRQAIFWFLENCWEKVLGSHPKIQLVLAGRVNASDARRYMSYANISITGEIGSIAEVIMRGDIAIAPMQSGAGMQNKILEAMSCGLPVVASSLGLGDIRATDLQNIIVADDPEKFIHSIDFLIKDRTKRVEIGVAARNFVESNYSWKRSNHYFIENILPNEEIN